MWGKCLSEPPWGPPTGLPALPAETQTACLVNTGGSGVLMSSAAASEGFHTGLQNCEKYYQWGNADKNNDICINNRLVGVNKLELLTFCCSYPVYGLKPHSRDTCEMPLAIFRQISCNAVFSLKTQFCGAVLKHSLSNNQSRTTKLSESGMARNWGVGSFEATYDVYVANFPSERKEFCHRGPTNVAQTKT